MTPFSWHARLVVVAYAYLHLCATQVERVGGVDRMDQINLPVSYRYSYRYGLGAARISFPSNNVARRATIVLLLTVRT
jgi:hypothetical protein